MANPFSFSITPGALEGVNKLRAGLPPATARGIRLFLERLKERLQKEGAAISYPVNWDSEKQRRAYFASENGRNGSGEFPAHDIPTTRTGGYVESWKVEQTRTELGTFASGYVLSNTMAASKYIGGDMLGNYQSKIHKDRWPLVRDEFAAEIDALPDDVNVEIKNEIQASGLEHK
jgi:hypothetical protein